jgi:DNA-binding SARP family transcriptional activator/Tfp pilus assembly protein PilF
MRFGILGPLVVWDGEGTVPVAAARQRVLLAALLVRAGQAVPADELADIVWDGSPPPGAVATLRTHVMRLRRTLGPTAGSRIVTRYPGYLVDADDAEVDILQFARLCREGSAAARARAWEEAFGVLTEALGLWRGAPLADIPSQLLHRDEVPRLERLRMQALESRMEAGLQLGHHDELLAELQSLAADHPLHERFRAQLMLALYQSNRQAEALEVYRGARAALVTEVGVEPGPELQRLHQRILAGDPGLAASFPDRRDAGEPATTGQAPPLPQRQLPPAARHFTGRQAELESLSSLLDQPSGSGTVVISAIGGTAGVGKTALALQWAHQVAEHFPDGQLYVNLRGYDRDQPMAAADALAGFLRALGLPGQEIPPGEDERAARYRSLIAGRRMLVVLDNAGSVEQVRPLLPGAPGCAVVVTSRDALAGLVARDGAERLDLDLLPLADAVTLLRALIGARADADPEALAALAAQCVRLPLALRVAAELAVSRPEIPLADLAVELADQQRRLDLLDAGEDTRTAVRAVFSWSYRHLNADAARAFRLLGLHPGADIDAYATAAIAAVTLEQVRHLLSQLTRAHLIQPAGPGRYGMHDLLRAYARELADSHDTEPERQAALARLFDHYLSTAAAAMDALFPAERHRRPSIPAAASPAPPVAGPAAARDWLDAERACIVAVARDAAGHGWPRHCIQLAATVQRYLDDGCYYPEAAAIHGSARQAARNAGDADAEGTALRNLGFIDVRQGRYSQAAGRLQQALALYREIGDRPGQAVVLGNLGIMDWQQGCYQRAADRQQQALDLFREMGDRVGEARALVNLSDVDQQQGRYQQAADRLHKALSLFRELGYRSGAARALGNLGCVDQRQGRFHEAAGYQRQALDLFRELSDRHGEAHALSDLGVASLGLGRLQQAAGFQRQALDLFRELGERSGEAVALNGLGEAFLAAGEPGQARLQHAPALKLAGDIGDRYEQARAHNGLACAYDAIGDQSRARRYRQQALTLYTELGAPEADQLRAQLGNGHDPRQAVAIRPGA